MHEPADLADPVGHLESIWRALAEAAASRDLPWRTPTLATLGIDGSPQARTIVLRAAHAGTRGLMIYSDVRSPKIAELARDPRATLSFWDASRQMQLRADGTCVRVTDAASVAEAWKGVPESNRLNYRTTLPPGSAVESPQAVAHVAADGVQNFALLSMTVTAFDWLWLDRAGHKRCRFDLSGATPTRQWLVP